MPHNQGGGRCRWTLGADTPKTKKKNWSRGTRLVGCKARVKVGTVGPLGHVRRNKEKTKLSKRNRLVGYKARTGFDYGGGGVADRCNLTRRMGIKQNRRVGWGASTGPITRNLQELST